MQYSSKRAILGPDVLDWSAAFRLQYAEASDKWGGSILFDFYHKKVALCAMMVLPFIKRVIVLTEFPAA